MAVLDKLTASVLGAAGTAVLAAATCSSCESDSGVQASDAGQDAEASVVDTGKPDTAVDASDAGCAPLPAFDGTVLTDPKIWRCVPDDRGCASYLARAELDPFPKLIWKPCGPGCEETDASMPIAKPTVVEWPGSSAVEKDGDIAVRLRVFGDEDGFGPVHWVFRLSDSKTVFAARNQMSCASLAWTNDGALGYPMVDDAIDFARVVRAVDASPAGKLEVSPWVSMPGPLPTGFFAWEDGWGMTFSDATVRVVTSPDATSFTTIDTASTVYELASKNHLLAWPGNDGTGRRQVKAWGLQNGLQVLWTTAQGLDGSASDYVNSVALSDKYVVWVVVDGPGYKFTKARMLWSPFATTPAEVQVTEGPEIPATGSLQELRTGGDFAAAHGCYPLGAESAACPIFVVRFSTEQVWAIPPRAGSAYMNVMAVSDEYVLVAESNWPPKGLDNQMIRRLLRFRTDQLDALEGAW